jgi:hypothetical protein
MPSVSPTSPPALITQRHHLRGCVTLQRLTQHGDAMLHRAWPVALVRAAVRAAARAAKNAAPWQHRAHRARVTEMARLSLVLHRQSASCIAGQQGRHRTFLAVCVPLSLQGH